MLNSNQKFVIYIFNNLIPNYVYFYLLVYFTYLLHTIKCYHTEDIVYILYYIICHWKWNTQINKNLYNLYLYSGINN